MFHTTAWVRDYEAARNPLMELFGQRILEDTRIENPQIARRGGMTWIGDNSIELGQPIVPGAAADRFVERHGPGMHSIALQVEDVGATAEHARAQGVRIIDVNPGLAFCHPKDTGGVFVEWFSAEPDFDPRFGAAIPPGVDQPAVTVERMAFAGAVVDDPIELAQKLAALFGTEVTFSDEDAPAGAPVAGVSLVDNILALYRFPGEQSLALWGAELREPKVHVMGLSVPDLADARSALLARGVTEVRSDAHMMVVSPASTGHVPVVVTDELFPGDPRLAA